MNYSFELTEDFKKEFKPLLKKYPSLKKDFENLSNSISENPQQGVNLGEGFKKIRIDIKSKGKGARGGGRIITYEAILSILETKITFVSIYNKSEYNTVDLQILKKNLGFSN
jgi:mRNA-degrading endonuclease RelE of RelBE toxin-antitoxin system